MLTDTNYLLFLHIFENISRIICSITFPGTEVRMPSLFPLLSFFLSSRTLPYHCDLLKIIESGLEIRQLPQNLWVNDIRPQGLLCSLFKCFLIWLSSIFLAPGFPTILKDLWFLKAGILPVKTDAKKPMSISSPCHLSLFSSLHFSFFLP